MWRLVRAELAYHRWALAAVVGGAMPLLAVWTAIMESTEIAPVGRIAAFVVAWALSGAVAQARQSEHRETQLVLLPLAAHQVALARLVVQVGPVVAALGVHALVAQILRPEQDYGRWLQLGVGLCLFAYAATAIVQDLFSHRPRTRYRPLAAAVVLVPVMALAAYVAATRDQPHPVLVRLFRAHVDWLGTPEAPTRLLFLSLVIAFLSLVTFGRRKSYLHR